MYHQNETGFTHDFFLNKIYFKDLMALPPPNKSNIMATKLFFLIIYLLKRETKYRAVGLKA